MTTTIDFGSARGHAIAELSKLVETSDGVVEKAVIVHDLYGLLRVILWLRPSADEQHVREKIKELLAPCGHFWTGDIWVRSESTSRADRLVYDAAWDEGLTVPGTENLRIDDRVRTRSAWLPLFREPLWKPKPLKTPGVSDETGPRIVVFYSFKGGVGRTTGLAAFALQRAKKGERVFVIDFDLDAPGVGTLLAGDHGHCSLGIVDYLLDAQLDTTLDIERYVHRCGQVADTGEHTQRRDGEIVVMPAGCVDENYVAKLSRIDLEIRSDERPLDRVFCDARDNLRPDWILIDSRAGLSSAAGLLLDGTAHLHVVFGTTNPQNQLGLTQVLGWLGAERAGRGFAQAACIVVQAMGVDIVAVEKPMRGQFNKWLEETLTKHYVVSPDTGSESPFWSAKDLHDPDSPIHSVWIPYSPRMAFFSNVRDVAEDLASGNYLKLGERIERHFEDIYDSTM